MSALIQIALETLNDLLTAGIAITAFSLLLYALSFNLRDRVTRSFAIIMLCVVIVFVAESIGNVASSSEMLGVALRLQWVGIIFLPAAYLHLSDAVLATTGRPSRGRRRLAVRLNYLVAVAFLITLPTLLLVGPLNANAEPAPHLERTRLTLFFTLYYIFVIAWSWVNFYRAYQRTVASSSRRRMSYLMAGALAPALGSYPYLLFGSGFAAQHTLFFWATLTISNLLVSVLLIVMAYAVAFFGVPWPDRVVKRRLFKWLMRGPVTASTVLAVTTIIRRTGLSFGLPYNPFVPVAMVFTVLIMEHLVTLVAPVWERWLFYGKDRSDIEMLQSLEERLLTRSDLHQFLEAILTAVADRLQVQKAFLAGLSPGGLDLFITTGGEPNLDPDQLPELILREFSQNGLKEELFAWGDYWLLPLYDKTQLTNKLVGLVGVLRKTDQILDSEQSEALAILAQRASMALLDRQRQQQVFSTLEEMTPQMDMIQRLRAAARYDGSEVLATNTLDLNGPGLTQWVKDALTHYWGGPKLTENPLMDLSIVQNEIKENQDNPTNALRTILRQAIEHTRPVGERRFTAEWILYNILEMKFMEGRKVREIALRLAMSEADLYRKQRIAVEAVANVIAEMEQEARKQAVPVREAATK